MRKILSLIIVIIMVMTMIPAIAFADEPVVSEYDTSLNEEVKDENPQANDIAENTESPSESVENAEQSDVPLKNEELLPVITEESELLEATPESGSIWEDSEQPDVVDTTDNVSPDKITDAIKTCADALKAIGADDTKIKSFVGIMSRISNWTSLAGGGVAILKLIGIIEDPYMVELSSIKSLIEQQNITLSDINKKITALAQDLKDLKAEGIVNNRASRALSYTQNWLSYRTHYLEEMQKYMDKYQGVVLHEVQEWTKSDKENLYAYYTMIDGKKDQTFSRKKNMDLEYSEGGEVIAKEYTIGLPASYVKDAIDEYRQAKTWSADTFRKDIVPFLAGAVTKAMDDDELGCSGSFRTRWDTATDKQAIANEVAADLLDTAVFIASTKAVNNTAGFANEVLSKMNTTWVNTKDQFSGIASQIIPLKMTYCFEGEARDQMCNAYDGITALTSMYSMFAMTVASQSDTVVSTVKKAARKDWVEGMDYIKRSRAANVTGKDNYCYLTDSLLQKETFKASGVSDITTKEYRLLFTDRVVLLGYSSKPWQFLLNGKDASKTSMLNDENALALYKIWNQNRTGKTKTFKEYLQKYGTNISVNDKNELMTAYNGARTFSLNEGIPLECARTPFLYAKPKFFKEGNTYNIMTESKYQKHTCLHDKVSVNTLDMSSGKLYMDKTLVARAQYCEGRATWIRDEPWYFQSGSAKPYSTCEPYPVDNEIRRWEYVTNEYIDALVCSSAPKKNIMFSANEFDPNALVEEMASSGMIDTTYKAHEDEPVISRSDWESLNIDYVYSMSDDELDNYADEMVDMAVREASSAGKTVVLSENGRNILIKQIGNMIRNAEKELSNNKNINKAAFLDPFNIFGDNGLTEKLARKILPDTEIATDGQLMEPVGNMMTATFYEPYVKLNCVKQGDSYILEPVLLYDLSPYLLVWCDQIQSYNIYPVNNDAIKQLGLTMRVRIGASDAGDNDMATIVHYDDEETMNILESKTVMLKGSGSNRYAEIIVSGCSPFSIAYLKSGKGSNVKTGDDTWIIECVIGFVVSAIVLSVFIAVALHMKKKRN